MNWSNINALLSPSNRVDQGQGKICYTAPIYFLGPDMIPIGTMNPRVIISASNKWSSLPSQVAAASGDGTHMRIRLMNEYTVTWPLWAEDGNLTPGDIPLSNSLEQELHEWASRFNAYYDPTEGWPNPDLRCEHALQAAELLKRLRGELPPAVEVEPDFWELREER